MCNSFNPLRPVVELVSCLVDLVFVAVIGAQQLLGHVVHVSNSGAQVVHLRLKCLKPAAKNITTNSQSATISTMSSADSPHLKVKFVKCSLIYDFILANAETLHVNRFIKVSTCSTIEVIWLFYPENSPQI